MGICHCQATTPGHTSGHCRLGNRHCGKHLVLTCMYSESQDPALPPGGPHATDTLKTAAMPSSKDPSDPERLLRKSLAPSPSPLGHFLCLGRTSHYQLQLKRALSPGWRSSSTHACPSYSTGTYLLLSCPSG